MKQKYLIFIAVGTLLVIVFIISLLGTNSLINSKKTTVQYISVTPVVGSSQSGQDIPRNNSNTSNNSIPSASTYPYSDSIKPRQYLISPVPSPTQSPVSSFTSALNVFYGNPNNKKTVNDNSNPPVNKAFNANLSPIPTPDPLRSFINALNMLFSFSNANPVITTQSQSSTFNPQNPSPTPNPPSSNLIYYPQCHGPYDNDPMPNGCNLCAAGCGPTSVAMILSSYVDKKYDPPSVLSLYAQSGLEAGCKGTTIVDAQQILNQNGIKTTDINYYGDSSFDETVQDFKQYLNSGWTLLTLVKYGPNWGHFYWVVNVDESNTIWAYDPGDAKRPVPLNENSVSPPAKYYLAIGVRK